MRKIRNFLTAKAASALNRFRAVLLSEDGDFYISDGVKIIIAVVLGALLLAAPIGIFNDTVIPRITQEIQGYSAKAPGRYRLLCCCACPVFLHSG